ncbi:MAG: hypothetical protein OEV91_09765, partial [Desulfobulbaceae bacterium]|nr:hypothetical protein [Desulfobulbaceae bacterium]
MANQAASNQLTGNAIWNHGVSGAENSETMSRLSQRYSTNFSSDVTSAMGIDGNLSYGKNWSQGYGSSETLMPNLRLNIKNDIFNADLSGMASKMRPATGPDSINQSWDSTWQSVWNRKFWPTLRLNYGQSQSTNNATPSTVDNGTTRMGLSTDWDL